MQRRLLAKKTSPSPEPDPAASDAASQDYNADPPTAAADPATTVPVAPVNPAVTVPVAPADPATTQQSPAATDTSSPKVDGATTNTPSRTPGVDPLSNSFLYCPQKSSTCKPLSDYQECNLAKVPSQAFVALPDFLNKPEGQAAKQALLKAGGNPTFMNDATKVGTVPFVLITKGTNMLIPVEVSTWDYLGGDFSNALQGLRNLEALVANDVVASSGGGSGGLGTPAIIAISVVVAVIVLALIAVGIAYYYKRKRDSGWKKYQDAVKEIRRI